MSKQTYDLCVIGGGINGVGIARDAAGRGLSVLLVEAQDLASATSSSSTKLIHGGLRYLEYYEFSLVKKALKERETLMDIAPHIIWPLKFVLPHDSNMRSSWLIRAGLFLYDHLDWHQSLPRTKSVSLKESELKKEFTKGFSYYDCWADDARLVVLNAMSAEQHGADIRTYTKCTSLEEGEQGWVVHLEDSLDGSLDQAQAKMVVNASGPWVKQLLQENDLDTPRLPDLRLVKGSHIVIKKAGESDQSYIFQQPDKRIIFSIPYEQDYLLVGTTEEDYEGDPYEAGISDAERNYLCAAFNRSFQRQITPEEIVWDYSGVRPLFNDGAGSAGSVTRDYRLHLHKSTKHPMLSVFGGKLTTYRVLARRAVDKILGQNKDWTGKEVLPGGDIEDFDAFLEKKASHYPFLPEHLLYRYARSYGTHMDDLIGSAKSLSDLGEDYGDGVYEAELRYLKEHEYAKTAEDVLWRRSKLGLHVGAGTVENVERAMEL